MGKNLRAEAKAAPEIPHRLRRLMEHIAERVRETQKQPTDRVGHFWQRVSRIAAEMHLSRRRVQELLRELEKRHWLALYAAGGGRRRFGRRLGGAANDYVYLPTFATFEEIHEWSNSAAERALAGADDRNSAPLPRDTARRLAPLPPSKGAKARTPITVVRTNLTKEEDQTQVHGSNLSLTRVAAHPKTDARDDLARLFTAASLSEEERTEAMKPDPPRARTGFYDREEVPSRAKKPV